MSFFDFLPPSPPEDPDKVTLGGWWNRPDLSLGYARAAGSLFRQLETSAGDERRDLVPPILYLVRHSVELALKDLLRAHHSNQCDQRELEELDGKPTKTNPLAADVVAELGKTHELKWLLDRLTEVRAQDIKQNWVALVSQIEAMEDESCERFRYDMVLRGKRGQKRVLEQTWSQERSFNLRQLLSDLEVFIRETVVIDVDNVEDCSLAQDLGYEGQAIGQEQYARGLI